MVVAGLGEGTEEAVKQPLGSAISSDSLELAVLGISHAFILMAFFFFFFNRRYHFQCYISR